MQAKIGDWLIVRSGTDTRPSRRGEIRDVRDSGQPPYTGRWTDTGHETLVFPGPDAEVFTAEQMIQLDDKRAIRAARLQDDIRSHRRPCSI